MKLFRSFGYLLLAIGTSVAVGSNPSQQAPSRASSGSSQTAAEALPKDVYPESGNRLPFLKREDLDEFGKKFFDALPEQERSPTGMLGPTAIRLHSPRVADYMRTGNQYLRNQSGLGPRLVELTILVAARGMDSQYEWVMHETAARTAGLEQEIIDIIKYRKPLTGLGEKDAVIIQLGREALGNHKVSSDTFARALKLFGRQPLVNIVSLMAHYTATAMLLETFDQQLSTDRKPLLPIP